MLLDTSPLVNGRRMAFASIEAVYAGHRTVGFKALNYKHDLKPGIAKGASPRILGATTGTEELEAGFEMYKEEYNDFRRKLGPGYKLRYFDVIVNYQVAGDEASIITDELLNCRIQSEDESHQEGTEPLTVKVQLFVQRMLFDGIDPVEL